MPIYILSFIFGLRGLALPIYILSCYIWVEGFGIADLYTIMLYLG